MGDLRIAAADPAYARGISPSRAASDVSCAGLQRRGCASWRCGMDGDPGRPSRESAVHRPSFPAAATILPDASL